jgi:recombinational DNA repair protein (RecF pathway)
MLHEDLCSRCEKPTQGAMFSDQYDDPLCEPCAAKIARKHFALQDGFEVSRARLEALFLRYALRPMGELRADPKRYASEVADLAFALTSTAYQYLRLDELEAEHDAEMRAAKGPQ